MFRWCPGCVGGGWHSAPSRRASKARGLLPRPTANSFPSAAGGGFGKGSAGGFCEEAEMLQIQTISCPTPDLNSQDRSRDWQCPNNSCRALRSSPPSMSPTASASAGRERNFVKRPVCFKCGTPRRRRVGMNRARNFCLPTEQA